MASYWVIGILICSAINGGDSVNWSPSKVIAFFKAKNVFHLDVALCYNKDNLLLMRSAKGFFSGLVRSVSEFKPENYNRKRRLGVFVDLDCSHTQKLLSNIDEKWFTTHFTWLIWDSEDVTNKSFSQLPMSTFSDVFKLNLNRLVRLHKTSYKLPMTQHHGGFWNSVTRQFELIPSIPTMDFKQSPLKIGIVFIEDVYNKTLIFEQLEDKYYQPDKDVGNRFAYSYLLNLIHKFNFKVEPIFADVWGLQTANGQWKGLMGQMVANEIDIGLSPMALIKERVGVVPLTVPTIMHWMVVVFKQPRANTTYRAMLVELSPIVWTAFGFLVFLGAIVLAFTEKYCETTNRDSSFVLGFLQAIGIITNQGLSNNPHSTSSRIVCLTMMIGSLLVLTYYSAETMRALLTKSPPIIKTLEQMLESNIPLSAMNVPYINHAQIRYKAFKAGLAKKLGEKARLYSQSEAGVRTILNGSAFAGEYYLVFPTINKLLKSNSICDLTVFRAGDVNSLVNFVTNKHYQELFQRGILLSMEAGMIKKERDYWLNSKLQCSPMVEFIHVPLGSITVALIIFGIGLLVSTITLVFEIYFGKRSIKNEVVSERVH